MYQVEKVVTKQEGVLLMQSQPVVTGKFKS
jgi:hypothetical protein